MIPVLVVTIALPNENIATRNPIKKSILHYYLSFKINKEKVVHKYIDVNDTTLMYLITT